MRTLGASSSGSSARPAAASSARTCSAIAIEAERPVERIPPTRTYPTGAWIESW